MIQQQHYREGYEAYEQFGYKVSNPYRVGCQEHDLWKEGYYDALRDELRKKGQVA